MALIVWSGGQSGICPGWLADIHWGEAGVLNIEEGQYSPSGICTMDYNPYRMVLAIDRDQLPPAEELPTEEVQGIPDGLVVRYGDLKKHLTGISYEEY
ncbi:MAG: hypothetical protein ACOC04_06135 [Halothece sp.]